MSMQINPQYNRRDWIMQAGLMIPAVVGLGGLARAGEEKQETSSGSSSQAQSSPTDKTKATPTESMMEEHAVFERILFIYQEAANQLFQNQTVDPNILTQAGLLVRNFVDDVHVPLEEKMVFPRLASSGEMETLITHLRKQHAAGRQAGDQLMSLAKKGLGDDRGEKTKVASLLMQYVRMNQVHAGREETEVYPAFRKVISSNEYDSLMEEMEKIEEQKLGAEGHQKLIAQVAGLEKQMGLDDMNKFLPNL